MPVAEPVSQPAAPSSTAVVLNDGFDTAALSAGDRLTCTAIASVVLSADEATKPLVRRTTRAEPGASR